MEKFFKIISAVFSPLIVPCYGIAMALCITPLFIIPIQARMTVLGMCALFLFIFPALAVLALYRIGIVKDLGLNGRTERTIPYCVSMTCYAVCAYYLYRVNAPMWLVGFVTGGILTIAVNLIVNLWWKISGHMAAMGGWLGIAFFIAVNRLAVIDMTWVVIVIILLCGLVATARLALERHTPLQVLAGTFNGIACIYISALLFSKLAPAI